jgi:hypothetical protein
MKAILMNETSIYEADGILVNEIISQTIRDLSFLSIESDIQPGMNALKFIDALEKLVAELLEKSPSRLMQFLYRVDVPEEKLKSFLSEGTGWDAASRITELIIHREWFKVKNRQSFGA